MNHNQCYIVDPKTVDDFRNNIQFQLDSVECYLSVDAIESAIIKIELLLEEVNDFKKFLAERSTF